MTKLNGLNIYQPSKELCDSLEEACDQVPYFSKLCGSEAVQPLEGRCVELVIGACEKCLYEGECWEAQPGLQSLLADIPARLLLDRIEGDLLEARDSPGLDLLRDLRAEGTDHGWVWCSSQLPYACGDV